MEQGDGWNEAQLKRHALQIAVQLPETRSEAMRVLEYAKELVNWEEGSEKATILQLIR